MSGDPSDQQRAPRASVCFVAQYGGKRIDGTGSLCNLSRTGALVEPAEPTVPPGARLKLEFRGLGSSIELAAEVVRRTDAGFAVRFADVDAETLARLRLEIAEAAARDLLGEDEDESTLPDLAG